jgi:hypothetical protein
MTLKKVRGGRSIIVFAPAQHPQDVKDDNGFRIEISLVAVLVRSKKTGEEDLHDRGGARENWTNNKSHNHRFLLQLQQP